MRDIRDGNETTLTRLVRALTLVSFALSCWTLHRALRPRPTCVSSSFVRAVVLEGQRVDNCVFESRLRLGGPRLSARALRRLRRLEDTAVFNAWIPREPRVTVEVDDRDPDGYELRPGHVRFGGAWFEERFELDRVLALSFLTAQPGYAAATPFALEVMADFVTRAAGRRAAPVEFTTVAPTLGTYCANPAPADRTACRAPALRRDADPSARGFRPLFGLVLARTFAGLPLADQLRAMARVRRGVPLPVIAGPKSARAGDLAAWFTDVARDFAGAAQLLTGVKADRAFRGALETLDVGAPIHLELTVDLRHTPKWHEITKQLLARARFRPRERALIFTPEGEVALPSGAAVHWAAAEVESKTHVMIACAFPPARGGLKIRSQTFFARRTCDTLTTSFWD